MRLGCVAAVLITTVACQKSEAPDDTTPVADGAAALAAKPAPKRPFLLLSQAQFEVAQTPDGKPIPKPGPAKLVLLQQIGATWQPTVLEDEDSRVFHKAICTQGTDLLTIGATDAHFKTWRWADGAYQGTSHWKGEFGGKWDRLRDVEGTDLNGDGNQDWVIGTHDEGVIVTATAKVEGGYAIEEHFRRKRTFVHEIELGDVHGNGKMNIYSTPSNPNKATHSQGGTILALVPTQKGYREDVVATFGKRHAKEILVADVDGDGKDDLLASVEAEKPKGNKVATPLEIVRYERTKKGKWRPTVVAELPRGLQARVLVAADLMGTGKPQVLVSTMRDGIWMLTPQAGKGPWPKQRVAQETSGFEHAMGVADMDGDGKQELYVAGDDQDIVRRYVRDGEGFVGKTIYRLGPRDLTWAIEACL